MTKNTLEERDNNLATVDYPPLLKEIIAVLKQQENMFHTDSQCLTLDIDRVAMAVVEKLQRSKFKGILPFTYTQGTHHVTANFADSEAFKDFRMQIERVRTQLQNHLDTALAKAMPGSSITSYVTSLLSEPAAFKAERAAKLHYPFDGKHTLKKRRLHIRSQAQTVSADGNRLRGHKLTITVKNLNTFGVDLIEGLCNKLRDICDCSEHEIDGVRSVLQRRMDDDTRELSVLRRIVQRESIGRLQKEAKIRYLEYLSKALSSGKEKGSDGLLYLQNLVKRLRRLEAFINDQARSDGEYLVSYGTFGVNYRDLFSRADAFDMLPIISEIEGSLGETFNKDDGEQVFIAGIKLKLNGPVQTHDSVFAYYLKLLDPDSLEHQERKTSPSFNNQRFVEKVLKIALLYYFVFKNINEKDYDPATEVERDLLSTLKGDDEDAKIKKLHNFSHGLDKEKYKGALTTLKGTLKELVTKSTHNFAAETYPLHLSINDSILDLDCDRMLVEKEFFQPDALQEKGLKALKHISIQEPTAEGDALSVLPVTFAFEPVYYYTALEEPVQQFTMQYDLRRIEMLPVLFVPNEENCKTLCATYYQSYKRIVLRYQHRLVFKSDSQEAFVYRFTFLLLSYMCLKLLLDSIRQDLQTRKMRVFLPMVRIHLTQKAGGEKEDLSNEEEIIKDLSKVLAHMLGEEHSANAQGFHIGVLRGDAKAQYKLPNGLSSLYSVLPKAFKGEVPPALERLAIMLVSSRKCDSHFDSPIHLSNIYGEVVGIQRYSSGAVWVRTLNTFSANEESDKMYRMPTVIRDEAKKCYERGYRHILYVAMAPYTSTLHLTGMQKDEEQFFMSKDVIQALKDNKADLNIYPIYCDKYYVVKVGGPKIESLYVDDTSELRTLVADPNRSSVVFFNLLNGITVGPNRVYNGVVSYATLVNVYDDPIYDQTIRNNLLDSSQSGSLKGDILDFLTLLHFSRYEKSSDISFKLDPYENIIGSDSVGSSSLFPHMISSVRFNSLAFLTEVRGVLNKQYLGYSATLQPDDEEAQQ